jgi:hypothetical protein
MRGGPDMVVAFFGRLEKALRTVMILTGSRRVSDLRRGIVWQTPEFSAAVDAFTKAETQATAPAEVTENRGPGR